MNRPASASSTKNYSAVANAVDGSTATAWSSKTVKTTQWVQVDLGTPAPTISFVKVVWPSSTYARSFAIQTSTDGTTFTT